MTTVAFVPAASARCAAGDYLCVCAWEIGDPCPHDDIGCAYAFTVQRNWNPGGAGIWCDGGSVPVRLLGLP